MQQIRATAAASSSRPDVGSTVARDAGSAKPPGAPRPDGRRPEPALVRPRRPFRSARAVGLAGQAAWQGRPGTC